MGWTIDVERSAAYDNCAARNERLSRLASFAANGRRGWFVRDDGLIIGLSVVVGCDAEGTWLHVSCSHGGDLPLYDDLQWIYKNICEPGRPAVEVHVSESEHVNIAQNCRHLWQRLDKRATPDFRVNGQV